MPAEALPNEQPTIRQPSAAGAIPGPEVIASLQQHGIPFSAENYTVWQAYLAGTHIALKRAIDIVLSNGLTLDERALRALYVRHFCPVRDMEALRDVTKRTLETVGELREVGPQTGSEAFLERLGGELAYLSNLGESLARKLAESEARIAQLEYFLSDARQEASTDPLTGVANRRAMDRALRAIAGDAMNEGSDVAFVLLDIDHFKKVNDNWGHPVGDEALQMIATTLAKSVRSNDFVARYGGEEFAVILPGEGRDAALKTAERLRAAIEAESLLVHGPAAQKPGGRAQLLSVTISGGVSCYQHGESFANWMNRADTALYAAKRAGRNQVIFGELEPGFATRPSNVVPMAARA